MKMIRFVPVLFFASCHYLARCQPPFVGVAFMGPVRDTSAVVRVMVKSATSARVVYYPDRKNAQVTEEHADLKDNLVIAEIDHLEPDTEYRVYVKAVNQCLDGPITGLSEQIHFRTAPKVR